jgi:t-SNARE complex subunit (syntaxin)
MEEEIKDIKEIELFNDIKLLNVIINDLGTCVKDQGLKLDRIENNLTRTDDIIDRSITELDKANKYKEKINKKYLTLAGIGGILIYLLIL